MKRDRRPSSHQDSRETGRNGSRDAARRPAAIQTYAGSESHPRGMGQAGPGRNRQKSGPPSADGLPEMPEASELAWALNRGHEENPVRSRMEHTGETARQRARPPG